MRIILIALTIVLSAGAVVAQDQSVPRVASPPPFCLSDEDLRIVVVQTSIESLRETADTCGKRCAELSEFADSTLLDFDLKYAQAIAARDSATKSILSKSGMDEPQQNGFLAVAQSVGRQTATNYSSKDCKNYLYGIKAMTVAEDFRLVERAFLLDWRAKRASMPRCGDTDRSSSVSRPQSPIEKSLDEQIKIHNAKVLVETKKRCLMPKSSLSFGPKRPLDPLGYAIAEQEANTEEQMFNQKCEALGILRD